MAASEDFTVLEAPTRPRSVSTELAHPGNGQEIVYDWEWLAEDSYVQNILGAASPHTAPHLFVLRRTDGEILGNGGWDRSRTRPLRILAADRRLHYGEPLQIAVRAWEPISLRLEVQLEPHTDR